MAPSITQTHLSKTALHDTFESESVLFQTQYLNLQDPWIQNASLRANVLMGAPFDAVAYEEALDAACLGPDLQVSSTRGKRGRRQGGLYMAGRGREYTRVWCTFE